MDKCLKHAAFMLLLMMCLLLSGCRTRVIPVEEAPPDRSSSQETGKESDASVSGNQAEQTLPDPGMDSSGKETRENPLAERKEYDENAQVEIAEGTNHLLYQEGEGTGTAISSPEASFRAAMLSEQAEETAIETVPALKAEKKGINEEAEEAESALSYYTVLLEQRAGSLFECQRINVYFETQEELVTIHKSSPIHDLILQSGAYDVSARLLPEKLRVQEDRVVRKNPDVIVKAVGHSVLGREVLSDHEAKAIFESIRRRNGWTEINAVKNGHILILSEELLDPAYFQVAAMLLIAKTGNEALFEDVDMDRAIEMLGEEATGVLPTGIYYYAEKGE